MLYCYPKNDFVCSGAHLVLVCLFTKYILFDLVCVVRCTSINYSLLVIGRVVVRVRSPLRTGSRRRRRLLSASRAALVLPPAGSMSILAYNGGAIIAMKGKDCVAIATDKRYGIQAQTVATNFPKVFEMGPHLYVGLPGLATDTQTVQQRLKFRMNLYELKENRRMSPKTFAAMLSNLLYERRFGPYFVEPVIAGLDPVTLKPFVCGMDLLGCRDEPDDFVVAGTCTEQLYGMCEALYEPNLSPDDLFETISQALVNAFDRDAISGWGGVVYIIEKDQITEKHIKTRMD